MIGWSFGQPNHVANTASMTGPAAAVVIVKAGIIVRTFAITLVLLGCCSFTELAAQSDDCRLCREDQQACVKAHSQGACKVNYDICMKHCRKR
jgi:hypothetical protein